MLSKDAAVHQGAIESANQDVIQGSLDLIVMQRQAEMMQKALTVFHTEFNKIASEDLPQSVSESDRLSVFSGQLSGINRKVRDRNRVMENGSTEN